ncbi:23S rRNA (uracil(1939)-C(5))-methyltransferase RlmD [Bacillus sp. SM2101]|uniref:23S rRNA (uracil(1939)-C(5))-methyltransferase RlmD n=1 Tax=Bacillus sp. SM2101 TaxID=2805366 RepID=UPI001BDF67F8|nr:23S rRNA (uracil(1939)-C(5))-methyltransferase RlmD [Bacillus sp. SM2101]
MKQKRQNRSRQQNRNRQQKQDTSITLTKGQQFPLTIKRLGINGEGVGYFKKQVVFVPGALPGEEILAEASVIHSKYAEAIIRRIRIKSPHRVKAPCPLYVKCGGCQLMHLDYNEQLKQKRDIVVQAFERYGKVPVEKIQIKETIGMEDPWNYRNKSQFQLGMQKQNVIAGLYGLNSHQLVSINNCMIQHEATTKVTNVIKRILQDMQIPIYNEKSRSGDIRTIVTRVGFKTEEVQVVLVTRTDKLPRKEHLIKEITNRLPEVKSIMQNINGQKTSLIFGEKTVHIHGNEVIQETLGDLSFELSARTFFQLNPIQTVKLYEEVKKAAALSGKEKIVDAYCGVGTIGLWLAEGAAEIRGMDVIAESIEDANKNAKKHGYKNATYVQGKAEELLPKWVKEGWKPDTIVVDPPRSGCDDELLQTIQKVKPKKVIYVSCNPSTLAKDIEKLNRLYKIKYIQPVDMFPHTGHVEAVAVLELNK